MIESLSFWEKNYIEKTADITIIGSGIVGLSTAIQLKKTAPHLSIKIIEREAIPYGASTKNAGFACFGSVSELIDDIKTIGEDACMELVEMRWKGLKILRENVGDIQLDYKDNGGTEWFRNDDKITQEQCLDKIIDINKLFKRNLNINDCYNITKNTHPNFKNDAIFNRHEGTINPVSMMTALTSQAIKLGVTLHNGIFIEKIDRVGKKLIGNNNLEIIYDHLIICTNGFARQLLPELKVTAVRNQVLISQKLEHFNLPSAYHVDKGYLYFRKFQDHIILGGGRNMDEINETTAEFGNTTYIQTYLTSFLKKLHPDAVPIHWWSGILGVGDKKWPIIKTLDDGIIVGVRLGGMGVAIGSYLAHSIGNEVFKQI